MSADAVAGKKKAGRENRKYLRIKLPKVLEADMSVVDVPWQQFKVNDMRVQLRNISSEGLCFTSDVRLPVNKDLKLQFLIPAMNGTMAEISGSPVWTQETDEYLYEYGVEFDQDPDGKLDLTATLYSLCKEMYTYN